MSSTKTLQELAWQCRRGLKELDVVLEPFLRECYQDLTESDKISFTRLLEQEDIELFDWLLGNQKVEDIELERIMAQVKNFAKKN